MYPRFNPDNPTGSMSASRNETPTPSRRSNSHLASTVFSTLPARSGSRDSRVPTVIEGTCETKQTSVEWPIRGVRDLKVQLESDADAQDDGRIDHEVLAGDGVYFDDLAYKLHLERSPDLIYKESAPSSEPTLSLAIVALWAKYSDLPPDEPFDRLVFVGIKPYEREGYRTLGEPAWIWSLSATATFTKRQEYWETALPPLSTLLETPEIAAHDALSIRVVVKHASEPGLPPMVHADQQFISRRITRQTAGFLDSARTGDVRFVCLEHHGFGTPTEGAVTARMARRRLVYAHSELLVHADYFKSALSGGFAEAAPTTMTTLLVDDAAFNTVYWVLRWLYTDEILFSTAESVRTVMAHVRVDKAAARRVLLLEGWDYMPIADDEDLDEVRTARSSSSVGTAASGILSGHRSPSGRSATSGHSSTAPPPIRRTHPPVPAAPAATPSAAPTPTPRGAKPKSTSPVRASPSIPRISTTAAAASPRRPTGSKVSPVAAPTSPPARASYASTPRRSYVPPPDPHQHPTTAPPPPSPLAVFFLAHRYGLDELQAVARDALLKNLTPHTCMATLLSTFAFAEIHSAIMDYVCENWAEVSASPELERSYQEVSAGIWGETDGGQVLLGLTRRLTGITLA